MKKIIRIINSRFKRDTVSEEVKGRIDICVKCKYNSLNTESISKYKNFLIKLSDFYSFIMGRKKEDIYGNCTACDSCSILFKAIELEDEDCPKKYWKNLKK